MINWLFCIAHFLQWLEVDMELQRKVAPEIIPIYMFYNQPQLFGDKTIITLWFSTKSKNVSVEKVFAVKTRVPLNAGANADQIPENQYNELKLSDTKGGWEFSAQNEWINTACEMQMDFDNPVDPDEQAITAAHE